MDTVAQLKDHEIHLIIGPTIEAFVAAFEPKREEIRALRRKSFQYGSIDRQQLDIYYPSDPLSTPPPILFFIYGGGFFSGDRNLSPPEDLQYAGAASFFTKRGFVVIVPDYRLAPQAKFPEPLEDLREALAWALKEENKEHLGGGDTENIFMVGHSVGAVHTSSLFLHPTVLPASSESSTPYERIRKSVKGIVTFAPPCHFNVPIPASPPEILTAYYGSDEDIKSKSVYGLLQNADDEIIKAYPKSLIGWCEKEPDGVRIPASETLALLYEKFGKFEIEKDRVYGPVIAKQHNHISSVWCLGSGQGEEWAEEAVEWIKKIY